jgi:hypothetical protein
MPALLERLTRIPRRAAELVLQREAEQRAYQYGVEQRAQLRDSHAAALRRIRAGRGLRDASDVVAAGAVYREAATLAARSVLAGLDPAATAEPEVELLWARLETLLGAASEGEESPFQRARRMATERDLLALDKLSPVRAREQLDQVDRALVRLLGVVEPRTLRRIRVSRYTRIALLVLVVVGMLAGLLIWALSPNNVALGKPVSAVSYWPGSEPASELVNGESESPWGSATATADEPWFLVDLTKPHRIRKIVVINRNDGYAHATTPLAIDVSDDGQIFRELARFEGPAKSGQRWTYRGSEVARFVRVRHVGVRSFALSEIEVYGNEH